MNRTTFQVNTGFGKNVMSAACMTKLKGARTPYPVVYARNLAVLLRRIKKVTGLKLEEIALEFQPE